MEINPIVKEVTTACNLRCKYCFFAEQDRRRDIIDEDLLEMIIKEVCGYNSDNSEIIFYWHGGEPTLAGIEFYEGVVTLQQKLKKKNQRIRNAIETNATLLDSDWAEFFRKASFEIGVSLDGPKRYHDSYRCYPDGTGSFDDVVRGIEFLKESGIEFSIIAVITSKSAVNPEEIFRFFESAGVSNLVNLVPALGIETGHGLSFKYSVSPRLYIDFLMKIFDLWLSSGNREIKILPLESIIRSFMGFPQRDCRFAGRCTRSVVIESNGDIYACNTYGYGDFFMFGNIRKKGLAKAIDPDSSKKYGSYLRFLKTMRDKCSTCEWYDICHGGCPGWYYLGQGKNILCKDFKRLFAYIQKVLREYEMIK